MLLSNILANGIISCEFVCLSGAKHASWHASMACRTILERSWHAETACSQILGLKNDHFHISETTDLSISGNDCYLASVSSRKRTKWLKYLHTVWNLQKFTILVKISWLQAGFLLVFGERLRDNWFHENCVPTFGRAFTSKHKQIQTKQTNFWKTFVKEFCKNGREPQYRPKIGISAKNRQIIVTVQTIFSWKMSEKSKEKVSYEVSDFMWFFPKNLNTAVWKFQNVSAAQILREMDCMSLF